MTKELVLDDKGRSVEMTKELVLDDKGCSVEMTEGFSVPEIPYNPGRCVVFEGDYPGSGGVSGMRTAIAAGRRW